MMTAETFSVIIPARNAGATLGACLAAVFGSARLPREVLVVNDDSCDDTAEVAARYPCRVLDVRLARGPMEPRFEGARHACSEILIFLDADVRISLDTFGKILEHFRGPAADAVTGVLARTAPGETFWSAFKNEYMNYIFRRQPRRSLFVYGSVWAVRRRDMIYFEPVGRPFGSLVSDSEMGFRLTAAGRSVVLDHALEVTHLKPYSFLKLMKNDFMIPFMFGGLWFAYLDWPDLPKGTRCSHATLGQVLANAAAACALLLALGAAANPGSRALGIASAGLLAGFYGYWGSFLAGLGRRPPAFLVKAVCLLPLDAAVMFCGMTAGLAYHGLSWLCTRIGSEKLSPSSASC